MALQVLQPLPDVIGAVGAALRPGGRLVATVPSADALTLHDRVRWLCLIAALRSRLRHPNDDLLGDLARLLGEAGMDLAGDEHRRFALPMRGQPDARLLVMSLYLPEVDEEARAHAVDVATAWEGDIGICIRRILAVRPA
jgi:hypothetical protein